MRHEERTKSPRTWGNKFAEAFRGANIGVRGQSSFYVHFFVATLVVIAALALGCDWIAWSLLILCIGIVLTAELFNSAIETLFHGLDEQTQSRCFLALDIAAGAVLISSITAALVGTIVFTHRLIEIFS